MYSKFRIVNKIMKLCKIPQNVRYNTLSLFIKNNYVPTDIEAFSFLKSISSYPTGSSINEDRGISDKDKYNLSIIIPAYNADKFITECLDSISKQITTYRFQAIVVNDGSTDETLKIIEEFERKYPEIFKCITQENKGFSGARNTGLDYVNSEYLAFVDSDDIVSVDFVEMLLANAYKNSADIVEGSYQKVKENGHLQKALIHKNRNSVDPYDNLYGYPWGKIYRTELFNNVKFPEGFWYEDTVGMYRIWPKAKKVSTISSVIYYYRINNSGITFSSRGKKKAIDSVYVTKQLLEDCAELQEEITYSLYDFTLYQMAMNFHRIRLLDKEILINAFSVMSKLLDEYFPANKFNTKSQQLKIIQDSLRKRDYKMFVSYCLSM